MNFVFTPGLRAWLDKKGKNVISVEVAESNSSDLEVTELFYRVVKEDFAAYLIDKKRYREFPVEGGGRVLLPPYHLEIDERVEFDVKKSWIFTRIVQTGIRL